MTNPGLPPSSSASVWPLFYVSKAGIFCLTVLKNQLLKHSSTEKAEIKSASFSGVWHLSSHITSISNLCCEPNFYKSLYPPPERRLHRCSRWASTHFIYLSIYKNIYLYIYKHTHISIYTYSNTHQRLNGGDKITSSHISAVTTIKKAHINKAISRMCNITLSSS